ncbi:LAME_0G11518g1_1 [Lachancea meyersii CBS 8951]|uniref:LAME_0G11518g1_1 n=1 Tax=Lachancea meyersii CBS 8951 TaxID=1266667 RepID=A0A1G4K9E5_9SACH|nr:LAME_0G11518g1_1 [Lachancea meyersii CBS 8951]
MLPSLLGTVKFWPRCSASIFRSKRLLTNSRRIAQRDGSLELVTTRGKKLKPKKAQIVILDPREAGLFKRKRTPAHFQRNDRHRTKERLSALQGVEFDDHGPSRRTLGSADSPAGDILQEIESQRRKLLVFKNTVPKEQVIKSIHDLKPGADAQVMSLKRYEQLKALLEIAYTLPQLKEYAKQYHNLSSSKSITKKALIPKILDKLWHCQVDETMSEGQDLMVERIIDVQTRDIYLLLLTNNGKILQNFARLGATVAVALSENKIIVRATKSLVKYVEVSLRKILDNVQREIVSINDLIQEHSCDNNADITPSALVSLVQKESATYFEELPDENPETYAITSFGTKRIIRAKNLLLWALDYNPQVTESVKFLGEHDRSNYMAFPFTDIDDLDWVRRKKSWFRLQEPVKKGPTTLVHKARRLVLTHGKTDELYQSLVETQNDSVPKIQAAVESKTWSITLGHILEDEEKQVTIFQPKVSGMVPKLMQLPLYDDIVTQDELYTVDQHEYYVQLKLIPKMDGSVNTRNIPPLELWFELDDDDKAINSTVRCLLHAEDKSLLLETPHLSHDLKVTMDRTLEVTKSYDQAPQNWLEDQPGLKEFLLRARLTFRENEKLFVPKHLKYNLQFQDRSEPEPVTFEYVNVKYHRVLKMKLMDKYLVQFSDVNGGSRGGHFKQVDFVNPECGDMSREEFGELMRNVAEFL